MVARTRPLLLGIRPALVVVLAASLLVLAAGPAGAAPDQLGGRRPLYYLALGDSLSRGVQPDPAGQNHPPTRAMATTWPNSGAWSSRSSSSSSSAAKLRRPPPA